MLRSKYHGSVVEQCHALFPFIVHIQVAVSEPLNQHLQIGTKQWNKPVQMCFAHICWCTGSW